MVQSAIIIVMVITQITKQANLCMVKVMDVVVMEMEEMMMETGEEMII